VAVALSDTVFVSEVSRRRHEKKSTQEETEITEMNLIKTLRVLCLLLFKGFFVRNSVSGSEIEAIN